MVWLGKEFAGINVEAIIAKIFPNKEFTTALLFSLIEKIVSHEISREFQNRSISEKDTKRQRVILTIKNAKNWKNEQKFFNVIGSLLSFLKISIIWDMVCRFYMKHALRTVPEAWAKVSIMDNKFCVHQ